MQAERLRLPTLCARPTSFTSNCFCCSTVLIEASLVLVSQNKMAPGCYPSLQPYRTANNGNNIAAPALPRASAPNAQGTLLPKAQRCTRAISARDRKGLEMVSLGRSDLVVSEVCMGTMVSSEQSARSHIWTHAVFLSQQASYPTRCNMAHNYSTFIYHQDFEPWQC